MKLKELREQINNLPIELDDCEVICQKDSEGNGYSPLAGVDKDAIYTPDSTYSGDVVSTTWTAQEACMSKTDWEIFKNENPRAIILYPTN